MSLFCVKGEKAKQRELQLETEAAALRKVCFAFERVSGLSSCFVVFDVIRLLQEVERLTRECDSSFADSKVCFSAAFFLTCATMIFMRLRNLSFRS